MTAFFEKKQEKKPNGETIRAEEHFPVLCKFWKEDDVWNGIAIDLPVVVCGDSFEETQETLFDAVIAHLLVVKEHGDISSVIREMQDKGREYFSYDEVPEKSPLVKFLVAVKSIEAAPAKV